MRTFVDTNVWVYGLDARDPVKQRLALAAISAEPGGIVVSPQVMSELYVTLVRLGEQRMDPLRARVAVDALRRFSVTPLESEHVMAAIELQRTHVMSYWDALILASAQAAGCERVLTEDLQHGSVIGGVRVENPFLAADHRLSEPSATYATSGALAWDDAGLREALGRYERVCIDSGMRRNAIHSYWDYARRFLDWREGLYPRGASGRAVPARTVGVADLRAEAEAYAASVRDAGLGEQTMETYRRHALFFVRWLGGEFEPGARARLESGPGGRSEVLGKPGQSGH